MHTILHIGIHKTGSKSLQRWMHDLAQRDQRFACPGSPDGTTWHKPLHLALLAGATTPLEALSRTLRETSAAYAFVSYEGFFDLPDPLAAQLVRSVSPQQTVIFLRDQVGYLNSFTNQVIKAHRTSWDDIIRQESAPQTWIPHLDFASLVQRWTALVEPERMVVIPYDRANDSIECFLDATSLPVVPGNAAPTRTKLNRALDATGLAVLREAKRRLTNPDLLPELVRHAHRMLEDHFVDSSSEEGAPLLLAASSVERIRSMYSAANERLRSEFGIALEAPAIAADRYVDLAAEADRPECRAMVDELPATVGA